MKAQRRHELQQSDLAKVIQGAPSFWQQSGGRWLIASVAVLVIVLLIRYRMSSNRASMVEATDQLAIARGVTAELSNLSQYIQFAPAHQISAQRNTYYADANSAISQAAQLSDDRKIQAEALIARAELDWTLATLPEIPGAATQPSLARRKEPKELFVGAAEAYKAVLDNFSDLTHATITARFGLAAIAENRHDFDAAKTQYDKILADTTGLPAYHDLATERLRVVGELRNPVILATPSTTQSVTDPLVPLTTAPTGPVAPKPATTQANAAAPATATATTKP